MNVILIGQDGERFGEMTYEEAEKIAKSSEQDLVMVDAKRNVYKIANAGRLKYEEQQRKKLKSANKRIHKIKEIQMKPLIETHDLEVKCKRIREFLAKGLRTKVIMKFKGRQMQHTKPAQDKFQTILNQFILHIFHLPYIKIFIENTIILQKSVWTVQIFFV